MMHIINSSSVVNISVLFFVVFVTFAASDRFSGLCQASYPRRVVHNETGHCYQVGSQGPCGRMAVIASDPIRPNYGICRCKDYGSNNCFGRPLISYEDRCYFEFSQGPCSKGQWFIKNKYGYAECRKMPCPIIERQRDLLQSEFPENDFYFMMHESNKCFKTGSQAFCNTGERVYFLGSDSYPQCLRYDPYNCNAIPTVSAGSGSGYEDFYQNQGLVFGVPYEGI